MKLIDRYIAKTILAATGLVTLMLAGLQLFILFVNQIDDLGRADFGIVQASIFVLLQMPYQVYLFFPMASLLGCLIGLGIMANNRELIVMRAAGLSIGQITISVLKAALILIFIVTIVAELLIPRLSHFANKQKLHAVSGGQTLTTSQGIWLRYHNDYIAIGGVLPNHTLYHIYQFRFNEAHQLTLARKIDYAVLINNQWHAGQVKETIIQDNYTQTREIAQMPWDVSINPLVLSLSMSEPDEMTLREIKQFLRIQKRSHQAAVNFQLAYWQRIIQPLTTVVMMILAIPFIFGPLRSSTMGSKLLAGAIVGFGFHILNRFFGPVSQVLQWPAVVAALGPTLLFAILGIYLMQRVR
ncbi:permease [Legionella beliardensis]|uniref:Permease n=1 Tax=Legionella beliardensis TaxID=91822 RepID=A0A378I403_9GAMM|nr:LPS export ABC transporter permease LptG [Legionella beliardensis]STX29445.1 permease [Legionella beliardensis]